jgi:hypothetical protein
MPLVREIDLELGGGRKLHVHALSAFVTAVGRNRGPERARGNDCPSYLEDPDADRTNVQKVLQLRTF